MAAINIKTPGIHHLALRSTNLNASRNFYVNLLGFPVLLEQEGLLIVGSGNFMLAIKGDDANTPKNDSFNPFRVGLDHFGLASATAEEIERVARLLKENGIWTDGPKTDTITGKLYVPLRTRTGSR